MQNPDLWPITAVNREWIKGLAVSRPQMIRITRPPLPRSWIHNNPEGKRVQLTNFWDPEAQELFGCAAWGPEAEGPPGCAHGGSIATVMDDVMGTVCFASKHTVVALNLNVNFKKFVKLGTEPRTHAVIERVDGRKVHARATLTSVEGEVHCETTGLFLEIDFKKLLKRDPMSSVG